MTGRAGARRAGFDMPLLVAGSAAFSTSTMFSSMKPVLISRFVEQAGYSSSLAGLAAAMPFVGGAVSSLLMPSLFRHMGASAAIAWFSVGLAVAELGNAFWFGVPALVLPGQFAAGLCGGILMGVVSRLIAVSRRSDQTFGIVDMVGVLLMSFMLAAVGAAVEWNGLRGAFLAACAMCAVFAAAMHLARGGLDELPGHAPDAASARLAVSWRAVAIIAMGVAFVTFSGLGFAFMVTAARDLGFGYEAASSAIGVILFLSAAGCLVGGWFSARFGPKRPLLAAFLLCAAGWHVALHTDSRLVFLAALGPAIFALQFCFPILLVLAGEMDSEGRLAAIAAPLIVSGFAWAAIAAGLIVDQWGVPALSFVTAGGMVLCAVLLFAGTSRRHAAAH